MTKRKSTRGQTMIHKTLFASIHLKSSTTNFKLP